MYLRAQYAALKRKKFTIIIQKDFGHGTEVFAFQLVVRGSDMVSTSITRSFILY